MLLLAILSGENELEMRHTQAKTLDVAVQNLRNYDQPITLVLNSGKRITISKALEGGDNSEYSLSVSITG
ncbi:MAG: hypothetical protein HGA36_02030 [Candidatus Moranbacteria bacterium]|nr:hypothetical protein [Candidatus Moranbacteria bacterium]